MSRKKDMFQFWPSDWLGGTASLTAAERGVYIDLLAEQWQRGPLAEPEALAAGRAEPQIVRSVLVKKFHQNPDGTWQNNRLEQERQRAGRGKLRKAPKIDSDERLFPADDLGQETRLSVYKPELPPVLVFDCRGEPSKWGLTSEQVQAWQDLYQGLDVLAECRKALAWTQANGGKTAGGMTRFLVTWLNRATDKSGGSKQQPQTFRERDGENKKRMLFRLRLEQMGIDPRNAERLSNLSEQAAMTEAKRILNNQTQLITQEEIPW